MATAHRVASSRDALCAVLVAPGRIDAIQVMETWVGGKRVFTRRDPAASVFSNSDPPNGPG